MSFESWFRKLQTNLSTWVNVNPLKFVLGLFILLFSTPFITTFGIKFLGIDNYLTVLMVILGTMFAICFSAQIYSIHLMRKDKKNSLNQNRE
jgi:antibiotic biosynthesis monooxygenase (ABM) superfamily enzyme